ncbi:hypothetical protein ACKKBG_A07290 [Auxenochlorella protothecoides x Auxenochlorella symbiontica]
MSVSRRLGFLLALLAVAKGQTNWTPVTVGSAASGGDSPAGSGACGYGTLSASSWPYDAIAVVNPDSPFLAGSAPQGCGTCLEIQCTDEVCGSAAGAFVALVTDNCDGCDLSQIYVSPTAYAKSFSPSIGLATGRATAVPCAPPGDIVVRIDTFRPTLGGYLRLVLLSVAGQGPIDSVELRTSGSQGDWAPLARSFGAAWDASSLPSLPLDIRITRGGDTLIVQSAITEEGQLGDIQTGVQFGGASSGLVNGTTPEPEASVNSVLDTPAVEPSPEEALALPGLEPGPESAAAGVISLLPGGQAPAAETVALPPALELQAPLPEPATTGLAPAPEEETGAAARSPPSPARLSPAPVRARAPAAEPGAPSSEEPTLTPAPVRYIPADVPTLPRKPAAAGPLSAAAIAAADPAYSADNCSSVLATLKTIPEVSTWVQVLTNVGLAVLLDAPDAQATLLVPTNSALDAAIAGGSVRDADTLAALLNSAPDLANPLAAYHVVKGLWPSWTLAPGTRLPTSATLDKVNLLQLNVTAGPVIRGVGSSANVLQADLLACGPSVIHIIDQVLLPFNFDQASLDAITATQVPVPPAAPSPAVTPAGRRLMRV